MINLYAAPLSQLLILFKYPKNPSGVGSNGSPHAFKGYKVAMIASALLAGVLLSRERNSAGRIKVYLSIQCYPHLEGFLLIVSKFSLQSPFRFVNSAAFIEGARHSSVPVGLRLAARLLFLIFIPRPYYKPVLSLFGTQATLFDASQSINGSCLSARSVAFGNDREG